MEEEKMTFRSHVKKIDHFIGCLKNKRWVHKANEKDIDLLFTVANDIERTFKNLNLTERNQLCEIYRDFDLTKSADSVIELLITEPRSRNEAVLYAINKYVQCFSKEKFRFLLGKLIAIKNLKDCLIDLNMELQNKNQSSLKNIEMIAMLKLWEEMRCSNYVQFENTIIRMLLKEPLTLLNVINFRNYYKVNETAIKIIADYFESQNGLRSWVQFLKNENLNVITSLCNKHSDLLGAILNFFDKYCQQSEDVYDEEFNLKWENKDLDFNAFVNVINKLRTESAVKDRIDEFLMKKTNNLNDNFTFWISVTSEL